jgi:hypothetical protein
MTRASLDGPVDDGARLRILFQEQPGVLSVYEMSRLLARLQSFFDTTYWIVPSPLDHDQLDPYYRYELREGLLVERLSYASPVEVILAIGSATGAIWASVRGAITVMERWEDWRLRRAVTNYRVQAAEVLRQNIPGVQPPQSRRHEYEDEEFELPPMDRRSLPRQRELNDAARILQQLEAIELIEGSSNREQGASTPDM